jgi:adenylosuccinate lyase
MELHSLTAVSPVDGRYHSQTKQLAPYFSEFGLMKYRVKVEIAYLIALLQLPALGLKPLTAEQIASLQNIGLQLSEADAQAIKTIEATTNHDVKAVEYFIKAQLLDLGLNEYKEYVHFGLTSQDVNNTAIPLSIKEFISEIYIPKLTAIRNLFLEQAKAWQGVSLLARTHGQPASPTSLGKEWMVFVERLDNQMKQLNNIPFGCKFGGATGNFNAHNVSFSNIDWIQFANDFCSQQLGLQRQQYTTQIEHYDNLAALLDACKRIDVILMDACKDIWQYISMDYFKQTVKKDEVGSSAMPHKVNPIDFENAEGNFGLANAIFEHLSIKLPISRLQRDLTDSTVLRNIGVPFAHVLISFNSLTKGLGKIILNESTLQQDLENNWMVVAEALQTILRRENYPNPYEALKALTRGAAKVDQNSIHAFIDGLEVNDAIKAELKAITPSNYIGIFPAIK